MKLNSYEVHPWREKWTHEDHLVNYRLTWLLVSQTLLFAAYGTLLDVLLDKQKGLDGANRDVVLYMVQSILPWVGMSIAALVLLGVLAALLAMAKLAYDSSKLVEHEEMRMDVSILTTALGWLSGGLFPVIFLVAWNSVICWASRLT